MIWDQVRKTHTGHTKDDYKNHLARPCGQQKMFDKLILKRYINFNISFIMI